MRVYILCEGQTEEVFIKKILQPYFHDKGIFVFPIILATKRTTNKKYKGGVSVYKKIQEEILLLTRHHSNEIVTTMLDLYQLPSDTPGFSESIDKSYYQRVSDLEQSINEDINAPNFFANLTVHEYEALLFSDITKFEKLCNLTRGSAMRELESIVAEFSNPEAINSSLQTAPSKRIERIFGNQFGKLIDGITIAESIGIGKMIEQCKHFREWIYKIASINQS